MLICVVAEAVAKGAVINRTGLVIKWLFRVVPWGVLIDRVKPIHPFIAFHLMGREGIDGLLLSDERTGSPPSTPGFAASIFYKVRIIS